MNKPQSPRSQIDRRQFLGKAGVAAGLVVGLQNDEAQAQAEELPNLVFLFADQMRAQACGYGGDTNLVTPNLDRLAAESLQFAAAVSGCPVCCPYRASLMTGQYPLTHGIFLNDLHLPDNSVTIGKVLSGAGYETAYIGKWHLNGRGRSAFIPPENRQGFKFWRVLECTHDYNNSLYYGDDATPRTWKGYDAIAQTAEAQAYVRGRDRRKPFALFLSWGPPHNPYQTAPPEYRARFKPELIRLRPNVPLEKTVSSRQALAGYYAHIAALDDCLGQIMETLQSEGLEKNTILVFTSDHGDMLGSQGQTTKQRPWDESILVPFLLRFPKRFGSVRRRIDTILNTPDIMPTLLGLCGIKIPGSVQGTDLLSEKGSPKDAALIASYSPFHDWARKRGGREFRGVRTATHTYVRDLQGPWLLYDNREDPFQQVNRSSDPDFERVRRSLDGILRQKLEETHDEFLPAQEYVRRFGYVTNELGEVPYEK